MITRVSVLPAAMLAIALTSCASTDGRLEPRFVAVHNAMTAMGLAQSGSISEGSLAQGADARIPAQLAAGQCYTFVGLGSNQVRDLDLRLLDEAGEELGHDLTHDAQAAIQYCPSRTGEYQVVVTMTRGQGGYTVTSWSGGPAGGSQMAGGGRPGGTGPGSCAQPLELAMGAPVRGDTRGASNNMQGSCARGDSPEVVYTLTVAQRAQVSIHMESTYDGALYLLRNCGDMTSELACNDDDGSTSRSRIDTTLEPGSYTLVVDGYGSNSGEFEMIVSLAELRQVGAVCQDASPLALGQPVTGTTQGTPDYFQATCAGGARSPDRVYYFDVQQRARLRVRQQTDHDGVLHLRRDCDDAASEVACNDDFRDQMHSIITAMVDPGRYYLYSDGYRDGQAGNFTINAELTPAAGGGAPADTCNDNASVTVGQPIQVDTIQAEDDLAGSCGGQGAPDVAYRFNVRARSRMRATARQAEFGGAMYVQRTCGGAATEVACAALPSSNPRETEGTLDTVLAAGDYVLVIDGDRPEAFGSVEMDVQLSDLAAIERTCRRAPVLRATRAANGTTANTSDSFQASCAGGAQSNDTVYRIQVARRSLVRIRMQSDYDGAIHLRRDCADAASELACNDDFEDNRHAFIETTLDRGTYFLIVDGFRTGNAGTYTVDLEVANAP